MTLTIVKKAFPVAVGAGLGFAYWYFIGCTSGHCPITSTWTTSTLYGAIVGATFLFNGTKKDKPTEPQQP